MAIFVHCTIQMFIINLFSNLLVLININNKLINHAGLLIIMHKCECAQIFNFLQMFSEGLIVLNGSGGIALLSLVAYMYS